MLRWLALGMCLAAASPAFAQDKLADCIRRNAAENAGYRRASPAEAAMDIMNKCPLESAAVMDRCMPAKTDPQADQKERMCIMAFVATVSVVLGK